jgi:hypothetical protein
MRSRTTRRSHRGLTRFTIHRLPTKARPSRCRVGGLWAGSAGSHSTARRFSADREAPARRDHVPGLRLARIEWHVRRSSADRPHRTRIIHPATRGSDWREPFDLGAMGSKRRHAVRGAPAHDPGLADPKRRGDMRAIHLPSFRPRVACRVAAGRRLAVAQSAIASLNPCRTTTTALCRPV